VSANPAALAVKQVRFEKAVFLLFDGVVGAKYITKSALGALGIIEDRPLRPPSACLVLAGAARLCDYRTGFYIFPAYFGFTFDCH
jgi:hypothetical protein